MERDQFFSYRFSVREKFQPLYQVWCKASEGVVGQGATWGTPIALLAIWGWHSWRGGTVAMMMIPSTIPGQLGFLVFSVAIGIFILGVARLVWSPFAIIAEKDEKIRTLEMALNPPSPIKVSYNPISKAGRFIRENPKAGGYVHYMVLVANTGNQTLESAEAALEWDDGTTEQLSFQKNNSNYIDIHPGSSEYVKLWDYVDVSAAIAEADYYKQDISDSLCKKAVLRIGAHHTSERKYNVTFFLDSPYREIIMIDGLD